MANVLLTYELKSENPISQGNTGTCWCFSTTSFYESEIYRMTGKNINLSELYPVYFEYIEKVKGYISTRGNTHLGEGSETNAVQRMMEMYGIVPFDVYEGKKIPVGKKSYALSFIMADATKTLTDKYVDKVMEKLMKSFKEKAGAELR